MLSEAIVAIEDALRRHDAGLIGRDALCDDKNRAGIKRWLWEMHYPPGGVWKKVGRPYWSHDAYRIWHQRWHALTPSARADRWGRPRDATIPGKAAGDDWLLHEHVVPQKVMLRLLIDERMPVAEALTFNIGAVITRAEDRRLVKHRHDNPHDPWLRYAATGIRFIPNPRWNPSERAALQRQ